MSLRLRLLALLLLAPSLHAAELPAPVAEALLASGIPASHVGVLVQTLDASEPELAFGVERSFNPASVMKLLTTLAALDSLGPAHVWKTRVHAAGEIRDGVLYGDLVFEGGGDPSLTLERFWSLLREVRAQGIVRIRGDVIIDQSHYAIEASDPGQFDNAPLRPYNAPPAALLVSHNALNLRLNPEPEGIRAWLDAGPAGEVELAITPDTGACNGFRDQLSVHEDAGRLRLQGRYPVACGSQTVWLNLLAPDRTVASAFTALWAELGGQVDGAVRPGSPVESARLLLEFESPPLAQIARDVNTYSNNVMAKMLYLNLGAARFGAPANWDKAERALRAWLKENGLAFPELVLENGAGLSRIERISATSLARLLQWATRRPAYFSFAASLPVLGVNGTTRSRLIGSPAAGRAWLKTGTLKNARNLAGYVLDEAGQRKVLVLLVNHLRADAAGPVQDALIQWAISSPETAKPAAKAHQNGN